MTDNHTWHGPDEHPPEGVPVIAESLLGSHRIEDMVIFELGEEGEEGHWRYYPQGSYADDFTRWRHLPMYLGFERLREACRIASEQFGRYADFYLAKQTQENDYKAGWNRSFENMLREALGQELR